MGEAVQEIPGLNDISVVSESEQYLTFRGIDTITHTPLLCKMLKKKFRDSHLAQQLRVEYEIGGSVNSDLTVQMFDWLLIDDTPAFLTEDFDGSPLLDNEDFHYYSFETYLKIAILTTTALSDMHQQGIAFCNITPDTILYNPMTRRLKLTDFSQAMQLQSAHSTPQLPSTLKSLPYISPEQTGRLKSIIDHRSDFYSLGACLYHIFTGRQPFTANNQAEFIHQHIAKEAPPPHEVNREIPKMISRIIGKLMHKSAEDRYQSCRGVLYDLNLCLKGLSTQGSIKDFTPGLKDVSEVFKVPEKLYGRDKEIAQVVAELNKIYSVGSKLLMVKGPSGIGKSSLINGLRKPVAQQKGYFLTGKFDQSPSELPYLPIISAFQGFINQIIAEGDNEVSNLRDRILSRVGTRGRLITDVIPELEHIIGSQPVLEVFSQEEQQRRFNAVLSRFIQACLTPRRPLVIFLDDMQWADSATLKFLEHFLVNYRSQGILFLGTYRDDEVDDSHSLHLSIARIAQSGSKVPILHLPPLTGLNIQSMIADALFENRDEVKALAQICFEKTHGNPFFVKQFLLAAHFEKHIVYHQVSGKWRWNEQAIAAMETTENLLPLQEKKLKTFTQDTLKILKFAACLGNSFTLKTLARVCFESQETTLKALDKLSDIIIREYKESPLVLSPDPLESSSTVPLYKFAHDRLQRAVYSLLSDDEIKKFHYQIGTHLKEAGTQDAEYPHFFDITSHLNIGADQITAPEEKLELAKLNLEAGKRALTTSANHSALNYLQAGLAMLPENGWKQEYTLTLSLHNHHIEAAYLCNNYQKAEELFSIIQDNCKNILDKVKAYSIQIRALKARNMSAEAVETGRAILKQLGVKLPFQPGKAQALISFLRTRLLLSRRSKKTILGLPRLQDPKVTAAMVILTDIGTATYYTNPALLPFIAENVIRLSLKHGNTYESTSMGYITYGFLECGLPIGNIETGYKFGQLSTQILEQLGGVYPHTPYLITNLISHWKEPLHKTITTMERLHTDCVEMGDFEVASNTLYSCTYRYFFSGMNLDEIHKKVTPFRENMERLGYVIPLYRFLLFLQIIENLRSSTTTRPYTFSGAHYPEEEYKPQHLKANDKTTLFLLHLVKLIQNITFNNYTVALEDLDEALQYQDSVTSSLFVPIFTFYQALLLIFTSKTISSPRLKTNRKVKKLTQKLRRWANHCPESFQHKYLLVMAELYRSRNDRDEALYYYEQAITGAENSGCIQDLALTQELNGIFLIETGRPHSASLHLREACELYRRWGAEAKVQQLALRFPDILADQAERRNDERETRLTLADTSIKTDVDLESMIKATRLLTGTIVEEDLLKNLLVTMIESAGAQRGVLLLKDGEKWQAKLQGILEEGGIQTSALSNNISRKNHSTNIVNYVAKTKESVVLDNASEDGLFISDRYVQKNTPKSILCTPLVHQDKISCIVYLENNFTFGAFSQERQEVLHMLGSHAAISLKNSSLYGELEETIEKLHLEIKKRKDTQLQLLHAEKLTALGRLSASIAHEFGNPLIGIQYLFQDIVNRFSLSREDEKLINIGVEECERMKMLIRDMQQLNRPSSGKKKLFDPHKAIENVLLFQKKNLSSHGIRVVREYCSDFTFIHAVEDQFTQVLVNLTLNAVDAMADKGGTLTVVTNQDTEYMDIIIKDTGNGIEQKDQKNIFEPFFSTKPDVEGTGLGLPVSYSIIKNHGGTLSFTSTPGRGSAFHIRLPSEVSEEIRKVEDIIDRNTPDLQDQ